MAQHDYVIANGTGAAVRSDLNNALAAIVSQNSGTTAPATTYAYQWWADTTAGLLKLRNAANNGWITLFQLDGEWSTIALENGTAAAPSIYFKDSGIDTGIYSPGADQVAVATNGSGRLFINSSGSVGIGSSAPGYNLELAGSNPTFGIRTSLQSASSASTILFRNKDGNGNDYDIGKVIGATVGNGGYGELQFYTAFNNTLSQQAVLTREGRLGIGTTSPVCNLDVFTASSATEVRIRNNTDGLRLVANTDGTQLIRSVYNYGLVFGTGTSSNNETFREAFRVDGNQRLLVGTTSSSGEALLVVQGRINAPNEPGFLTLQRGGTILDNYSLGALRFADGNGSIGATISGQCDGGTWTSGTSMPSRLVFSTTADGASTPTERMRITSSGQILYGTTTKNITSPNNPGFEIHLENTGGLGIYSNNANNSNTAVVFQNTTGRVGFIDINAASVTYSTSSDYRLKENVAAVTDGITRLQQLKPSRFNFIADPDRIVDGFIAHEVQTIVPEAITGEKDAVDDEGNPVYQGIDQSKLVPLLTAALQEAIAKIESLESRLTAAGI